MKYALALLAALALAGCVSPRSTPTYSIAAGEGAQAASTTRTGREDTDQAVYGDLIRTMLQQEQYYAALAHIQAQQRRDGGSAELSYFEAETRRKLGQFEAADKLYRGLLRSDLAGEAYHGLGLLWSARDTRKGLVFLYEAAKRQPTNALVRNDFGYALMRAGRYREALPEFATAVELDPQSSKARNNLLMLLILSGDESRAQRMAAEAGVSKETLSRLRKQALSLRAGSPAGGRS
ncbi:MAG TPA: tetratricopeptide repeat protein [Solimonas sp.]|nr:tetratricopeptide repeat protein [Solimonas sp.]